MCTFEKILNNLYSQFLDKIGQSHLTDFYGTTKGCALCSSINIRQMMIGRKIIIRLIFPLQETFGNKMILPTQCA